jgi:hypothetical protein
MESKIQELIEQKRDELRVRLSKINSEIGVANRLDHKFEAYVLHEKTVILREMIDELCVILNKFNHGN